MLGGRSEVLKLPLREALGHMSLLKDKDEMEAKNKEFERWINFLSLAHSHPLQTDDSEVKKARNQFIELIKPKVKAGSKADKRFETDIELLKKLKAEQEGG
ncbi:hypothetical protein [Priestia sp. SB1]|uniref:hypothetical protein n=1 Tax=Priestia sp. SB1 TaxID=3132359 RepID=UPI00319DEBDA